MRFGKGSKVEVLSKRDVPSGSWFPAEIVSGNGRYYNVKCDGDQALEKVQRKSIRPRPPPISRSGSWAPGDIVEVLENNSWNEAKIMEVIDGGNYAVVMLVESSEELKLHGSNIRIRRYWKGNRWVLADKEFEHLNAGNMEKSHDVEKFDNRKLQQRAVVNIRNGHNQFHAKNNSYAEEHCQFSLRGLRKRSNICLPTLEGDARAGAGRKMGAIKEEVKRQRLITAHSSKIPEKGQRWMPAKHASVGPRCCSSATWTITPVTYATSKRIYLDKRYACSFQVASLMYVKKKGITAVLRTFKCESHTGKALDVQIDGSVEHHT